ncbi:MAG: hypothetical protein WD472_11235 [Dehalococcoidia bacterium]
MGPFLEPHERLILDFASEDGVIAAATRIAQRQLSHRRWLAPNNRYRTNVLAKLREDANPQTSQADAQLAEYVAAAAILHCADGWGYLGRAVNAAMMGDSDTCRHLAYYAELRAALSALSTQGVGIFDDRHVIVGDTGQTYLLRGKRTHVIAWLSLRHWALSGKAGAVLAGAVAPHGVPIDEWVASLPNGAPWDPLGAKWLEMWGVDLSFFASDRTARNESSYRPTRLGGRRALPARESLTFLRDLWSALEPAGPDDPFFILDRHLLRRSLEASYTGKTNKRPGQDPEAWAAAVDSVLAAVIGMSPSASLRDFLLRSAEPTELALVDFASVQGDQAQVNHHLRMISRAALLLRVAAGNVRRLFGLAGIDSTAIEFWADALGEDRGLWSPGQAPAPLTDLWLDTRVALDDVDAVVNGTTTSSYRELVNTCAEALIVLTGCERVALWSAAA